MKIEIIWDWDKRNLFPSKEHLQKYDCKRYITFNWFKNIKKIHLWIGTNLVIVQF